MQRWWSEIRTHFLPNPLSCLLLFFCANGAFAAADAQTAPNTWLLEYVIHRKGMPTANQTEVYSQESGRYQVDVNIKGIGIYALLGERKMLSQGTLSEQGLQPLHFEVHQGKNTSKSLYADFDWGNKLLKLMVKGVSNAVALEPQTQDLASLSYQWRYWLKNHPASISVTTGKQRKSYQFQVSSKPQMLQLAAGKYKVLRVLVSPMASLTQSALPTEAESGDQTAQGHQEVPATANPSSAGGEEDFMPQQDQKVYWLAVDHQFLPVKILMHDDTGALIEQELSSLRQQQ